jgi:hypothetical protein
MRSSNRNIVVGALVTAALIYGGYAVYDFWRFSVPPLPPQDPRKNPLKSAAALDTTTAAVTKDPDVDVADSYKKSDKNAESRALVSTGRPAIKKRKLSDL